MWNLGVPGWFAPLAWGLALGGIVVALWSAIAHRLIPTAAAVLLMVGAGVGPISTYQTALALTAVVLFSVATTEPDRHRAISGTDQEEELTEVALELVPLP
jgi:hypothetical protein